MNPIKIVRQYDQRVKYANDLTAPNWQKYATRHGYTLSTKAVAGMLSDANRKKLVAVHDEIGQSEDTWFFWADADTAVSNMDITLESYVADIPEQYHLVFDVSHYGLSTGNFFARNTPLARQLLAAAITCGDANAEVNKRYATINGHDETTMKILMEHFMFFARHVTTRKIADFPSTHTPASFILHAAQRGQEERVRLLSPFCT